MKTHTYTAVVRTRAGEEEEFEVQAGDTEDAWYEASERLTHDLAPCYPGAELRTVYMVCNL